MFLPFLSQTFKATWLRGVSFGKKRFLEEAMDSLF